MNVVVYGGNLAATLPVMQREVVKSREAFVDAMCNMEDAFGFFFAAQAMHAIDIVREVRELGCHAPLVVLMSRPDHTDIANCLNAGADQVERADLTFAEVRAYIEAIPRRGTIIVPDEVKFGDFTFRIGSGTLHHKANRIHFGKTKTIMLREIIRSPGAVTNDLLAWVACPDGSMSDGAVKVHIYQLRQRFRKLCPEREYITTAYTKGYRFDPEGVEYMRYATGRMAYENRLLTWAK